jgi:hypothetical protein
MGDPGRTRRESADKFKRDAAELVRTGRGPTAQIAAPRATASCRSLRRRVSGQLGHRDQLAEVVAIIADLRPDTMDGAVRHRGGL